MKKVLRGFFITIMVFILTSANAFAMPYNPNEYTSVDLPSEILPPSIKISKTHEGATARGDFFIGADLIIKDNGNGDVGVFAKAYMSIPVDEVYITIYLDRWDADAERWRQVTYYDAEFYAKDYPDGLTDPTVDITFLNQKKGYDYRLRGVFAAVHNGLFEGFSPVTAGLRIE